MGKNSAHNENLTCFLRASAKLFVTVDRGAWTTASAILAPCTSLLLSKQPHGRTTPRQNQRWISKADATKKVVSKQPFKPITNKFQISNKKNTLFFLEKNPPFFFKQSIQHKTLLTFIKLPP